MSNNKGKKQNEENSLASRLEASEKATDKENFPKGAAAASIRAEDHPEKVEVKTVLATEPTQVHTPTDDQTLGLP